MNRKKIPTFIFLDQTKAFDTLSFDILLTKFKHYGKTGVSLKLLTSYKKDRYQYVIYKGKTSKMLEIRTGIPQGSISFVFILMISKQAQYLIMLCTQMILHCTVT